MKRPSTSSLAPAVLGSLKPLGEGRPVVRSRSHLVVAVVAMPMLVASMLGSMAAARTDAHRPRCTITGTNGEDHLRGTDGPDVICARGGADRVRAMGGDDVLVLGSGHDRFSAGPGDDRVLAGPGDDFGHGGGGNDRIFLQRGADIVEDWRGVDLLAGGIGDDGLCAYDGKPNAPGDRIRGGPGPDFVGADTADVVRSAKTVLYGGCWD